MFETVTSLAFFSTIVHYLQDQIDAFTKSQLAAMMQAISTFAVILMTIWFVMEGFAILSGRSRDPIMGLVVKVGKAALILSAATGLHMNAADILGHVNNLRDDVTSLVTGTHTNVYDLVDNNLKNTDMILSGINSLQGFLEANPSGTASTSSLTTALLASGIGGASPAMVGGAFSLLNQIALSLAIVFGPICILSLLFESTKSIFWGWIQYLIGIMFTMGILAVVTGWALDLTEKYAEAIIAADIANYAINVFGKGSGGYTSMTQTAMMQGGIGLLMTTLIITVPPMTMTFFRSSLGASFSGAGVFEKFFGPGSAHGGGKSEDPSKTSGDPTSVNNTTSTTNTAQSGIRNLVDNNISVPIVHALKKTADISTPQSAGQRGNAPSKVQEV